MKNIFDTHLTVVTYFPEVDCSQLLVPSSELLFFNQANAKISRLKRRFFFFQIILCISFNSHPFKFNHHDIKEVHMYNFHLTFPHFSFVSVCFLPIFLLFSPTVLPTLYYILHIMNLFSFNQIHIQMVFQFFFWFLVFGFINKILIIFTTTLTKEIHNFRFRTSPFRSDHMHTARCNDSSCLTLSNNINILLHLS